MMRIKPWMVAAGFFFWLCNAPAMGATTQLTLMLDWFPNVDHLPIYVARHQGFFEKQGISVKILSPSETSDGLKLAASGTVDMAVSYEPQTIIAASGGLEVKAVGRLIESPLATLMFLKGKGIEKPTDLTGKRIGYTVPGLMDVLLDAFARRNGIQRYTAVNVGFSIVAALTADKVDAVMGPFKTYETVEMRHRGYDTGYFELEKYGIPDYDELILVCSARTLSEKSEAVAGFVRAVAEAISRIRAQPEASLADYFAEVPEADKETETAAFRLTLPYFARDQVLDRDRWQTFADFAAEYRLIDRPVEVTKVIRNVAP